MLNLHRWKKQIEAWLEEDLGAGDATAALFSSDQTSHAWIKAKKTGVIAGLPLAQLVFETVDPKLRVNPMLHDGEKVEAGAILMEVEGSVRSLLAGERLALNLVQRLSGIATQTKSYVEQVGGLPVRIVDTRKTTPGLRGLEKYAVRMGGGHNHRFGLYDMAMLKDNHIEAAGSITRAVECLRASLPHTIKIEVEVETLEQVQEAIEAKADIIMLDNMSLEHMKRAVELINRRAIVEASGGITHQTIRAVAETGVDIISVGALTHSVHALDISMDVGRLKKENREE